MKKPSKDNIYYDSTNSYVVEKKDFWKLRLINNYPHKSGLDIGSGSGRWLKKFPGWKGIDIDSRAKINSRVKIGSVEKIPFNKNSFEIVLTAHILEHVDRKNFDKAISEIYRVLKRQGVLLILGPNPSHQNFYNDYTHINNINYISMKSILENHGFKVLEANFSVYKRFWFSKILPQPILNIFAPLLFSEYYVIAKKLE
jgi:ubiquinone/menaquinone biosynthesis C-methylase UbiE